MIKLKKKNKKMYGCPPQNMSLRIDSISYHAMYNFV